MVFIYQYQNVPPQLQLIQTLKTEHTKTLSHLKFSFDETFLAVASFDGTISVWHRIDEEYQQIQLIEGHENEVKCVEWHFSLPKLLSCGREQSFWIWEYNDNWEFSCASIINSQNTDLKKARFFPPDNLKKGPQIHEGIDLILTCSFDNQVKIWKEDEEEEGEFYCLQTLKDHQNIVWDVAFKNREEFFTCSQDMSICFYVHSGEEYALKWKIENVHCRPIYCLAFDYLQNTLFSGGGDNKITAIKVKDDGY